MDNICMHSEMTAYSGRARGVSLIELGMVMVFISLALVPVIKMIGGPESSSGKGNAASLNNLSAKQAVLANTMVDRVLASDFTGFNCNVAGSPVAFDPKTQLPLGTTPTNSIQVFNKCKAQNTTQNLYYQWTVVNLNSSNNRNDLPQQNQYYQATLNVMDENNKVLLTMPTNFLYNSAPFTPDPVTTGVSFSMDISNSMADGNQSVDIGGSDRSPQVYVNPNYPFASPYLFYRYSDISFPKNSAWRNFPDTRPGNNKLNMWDDTQLDVVMAQQINGNNPQGHDPDSSTPFNEAFPFSKLPTNNPDQAVWGDGVLGTGDCAADDPDWTTGNLAFTFLPIDNNAYIVFGSGKARAKFNNKMNKIKRRSHTDPIEDTAYRFIDELCSEKVDTDDWTQTLDGDLSRLEGARGAALYMLVALESKVNIARTLSMGFIPWGSTLDTQHEVWPETAQAIPGVPRLHFKNMRQKLLWINRADPNNPSSNLPVVIQRDFGTNTLAGLQEAVAQVKAKSYTHRIVILLTDGYPTDYSAKPGVLTNYIKSNMAGTDESNRITLYPVGLIEANETLLKQMANAAGGNSTEFFAHNVSDLKPIFETITYQIQKQALLDSAARYNITL